MNDTLLLIDGHSLLYRAYYALPPLTTSSGQPANAVFGFTTMLLRAVSEYHPTHLAVAFDTHAPTFRHDSFPDYKAQRKPMPVDLIPQLPLLKQLLAAMEVKTIEKAGFEADDIIGTLSNVGFKTVILTGDRDSFQLINDKISVAYTKKGVSHVELYTPERLKTEFGFEAKLIPDYKSIFGDASDNIPGVSGIGQKTASALVSAYGSLDNIYANLDKIKIADKLTAGKESAYLSLKLAQIDRNVPLEISAKELAFSFPFSEAVKEAFIELSFNSLAKKESLFVGKNTENKPLTTGKKSYKLVVCDTPESLKELSKISHSSVAAEIGDNLRVFDGETLYAIKLKTDLFSTGVDFEEAFYSFKDLFNKKEVILFDVKAVKKFLAPFGVDVVKYFDVKLAGYVADMDYLREEADQFCLSQGYGTSEMALALFYAADEYKKALKESGMEELYYNIELPLVDVLFRMESAGFKIDLELLKTMGAEYDKKTLTLAEEVFADCEKRFNINSPKQLASVLFEDLKIPYPKRTKNYSTAVEILEPLRPQYPVIDKILQYRSLTKLNNTYVEGLKKLSDSGGVVHTEFRQTLTSTGRLSSIDPNLQNIPVRTEEGRALRALFTAGEGRCLVTADYSQIELRLLAHLSSDPAMRQAFLSGNDFHTQTAAYIFGVTPMEVNENMRRSAKAINFGIIYGMSDYGLSQSLHISIQRAKEFIGNYFKKFPLVRDYLDGLVSFAQKNGYVKTIMGRVRKIPQINSSQHFMRGFGERVAMNMPLQGSAADLIKIAMIRVDKALCGTNSHLILQVHDELIVDADEKERETVKKILIAGMEGAGNLSVPLTVSVYSGKRWIDC